MDEKYLEQLGDKLMFKMKEEEYQTLKKEFEVQLHLMDLISQIPDLKDYEPMTFPFKLYQAKPRKDEIKNTLTTEEGLQNAKETRQNQVRVPKVVE